MNLRQIALVGLAALALGGTAVAQVAPLGQSTPVSPAPRATAGPAASTTPAPARGRGRGRSAATPEPSASDTPEPPQFSTMDGVWEVQLQPLSGSRRTVYSHFYITQKGDALSGTWVRDSKDKLPVSGTFDGRLFKLTATDAKNIVITMSGYAENFSDMVGLLTTSADPKDLGTPFTAAHRKKERAGY